MPGHLRTRGSDRPPQMATEKEPLAGSKTKKVKNAWKNLPHVWALIKPRRGILLLGLLLMAVNRVSGLILPASTKYLVDDVIGKHHIQLLTPIVLAVLAATVVQGLTSFTLTQLLVEIRAKDDRGFAQAGAGAYRQAAHFVLRREQDGRAGVAHHERRGRRAEFNRYRAGGVCRRADDRRAGAGDFAAHQRDDDGDCVQRAIDFWRGAEQGVCDDTADIPRAAEDYRGSYGEADRIAGRRAGGEGVSRGRARGEDFFRRRAAIAGQRAEDLDGDFDHEFVGFGA